MRRTPKAELASCKALIGKRCRLKREVRTRAGVHAAGTRWRISSTWRGMFVLIGITEGGRDSMHRTESGASVLARCIRQTPRNAFEVEP